MVKPLRKTLTQISGDITNVINVGLPTMIASNIASNQTIQSLVAFMGTSFKHVFTYRFASPLSTMDIASLLHTLAQLNNCTVIDGQYLITFDADGGTVTYVNQSNVTVNFPITEGDMLELDYIGGVVVKVEKHEDDSSGAITAIQNSLADTSVLTPVNLTASYNAVINISGFTHLLIP